MGQWGRGKGLSALFFSKLVFFGGGEKTFYTKITKEQGVRGVGYLNQWG